MNDSTPTKRCSKCKREFPATREYFNRRGKHNETLKPHCKECEGKRFGYYRAIPASQDGYKVCTKCRREFPPTREYFAAHPNGISGLQSQCKECRGQSFGIHHEKFGISDKDGFKVCSGCGAELPATLEYFGKADGYSYGVNSRCRKCKVRAATEWQQSNPERRLQITRKWSAHFRKTNPEKASMNFKKWAQKYPERQRVRGQKRRARKRSLLATFTVKDWNVCLEWWNYSCAYCGAQRSFWHTIEQEHFIPVSANGEYIPENIIPSCKSCNSGKQDRDVNNWLTQKFGKVKAKKILEKIAAYFEYIRLSKRHG